jgi:glycosyltransferase involved in cell wall biosynthesis
LPGINYLNHLINQVSRISIHQETGVNDQLYPLISIILTSLNSRSTIERALRSVVELDYPNIELIVIDGESDDGTLEILKKYTNNIDTLIVEKDNGVYYAMNKAVLLANGAYIYFLGADDIIINSWKNLSGKLRSENTIYYCNVYFPVTNQIYSGRFGKLKLLIKNICQQAIFYPRRVFEKYHFSLEYPLLSDYHLNLLLKSDPDFRFEYIDLLVAVFSEKGMSATKKDDKFLNDRLEVIRQKFALPFYLCFFSGLAFKKWLKGKEL